MQMESVMGPGGADKKKKKKKKKKLSVMSGRSHRILGINQHLLGSKYVLL